MYNKMSSSVTPRSRSRSKNNSNIDYKFKLYFRPSPSNDNSDDENFLVWKDKSLSELDLDPNYDIIKEYLLDEILNKNTFCITERTSSDPNKGMRAYVKKSFDRSHILICMTNPDNHDLTKNKDVLSFGLIYFPEWNKTTTTPNMMLLDLICTHIDHKKKL